jgi:iron complex outermembrane receptor protein
MRPFHALSASVSLLAFAAPLSAQSAAPATAPAASAAADATDGSAKSGGLEDIVVTARIRRETAMQTPAAVTALSAVQLERQSINTMQALAATVPNVSITSYFLTDAIYIRGIGNNGLQAGFEQQAGLFIDGVYFGNGNWISGGMVDVGSAEILSGPQGVYFGKNTIAGAFNIRTANPTKELTGTIKVGYETEAAERYVNATISGPITSTLGGRLTGYYSKMDGWLKDLNGQDQPGDGSKIVRATLLWAPTSNFDANLKGQVAEFSSNGPFNTAVLLNCKGPNNTPAPLARFGSAGSAACRIDGPSAINQHTQDGDSYVRNHNYSFSLNMHLRQDFGELTSVTGLNRFKLSSLGQQSLGSIDTVDGYNVNQNRQFSQELRYQTKIDFPVNFLVGGYYQKSNYLNLNFANVFPIPLQGANYTFDKQARQHGQTWSVFGEMQIKITPKLELDLADRYTDERKSANWIELAVAPYAPAQAAYGPAGVPVGVNPLKFTNNSPQAILTWKPTNDIMAYAAYKTGYLSGGYNINTQATPRTNPATLIFGPEKVRGGEVGSKFWLFDRKLKISAVAYYYKYTGLQEAIFDPVLIAYIVQNAAASESKGVELEGTAVLGRGLQLSGSIDYNDSHFTKYVGVCVPGVAAGTAPCNLRQPDGTFAENYAGVPTSMAPKWAGGARLEYSHPLSERTTLRLASGVKFSSKYIVDDILSQPSYVTVDASAALDRGPFTFAVIGRNLSNHLSCGVASPQPLTTGSGEIRCILNRPREIRFEASYHF